MICGHYVFSYPEFEDIKNNISNINDKIKKQLFNKLREYHSLHARLLKSLDENKVVIMPAVLAPSLTVIYCFGHHTRKS